MSLINLKNQTPLQLARYTASIICLSNLAGLLVLKFWLLPTFSYWLILSLSIIVFMVAYFLVFGILERYIFHRVKLIHKTIHRFKSKKEPQSDKMDLRNRVIDEVEQEVLEWAKDQEQEMDDLRELEIYRREFIGNISHELKTPIFNMQGYLYTLIEGGLYDENINMSYLRRTAKNLERLQLIVEELDMISRFESNQITIEPKRFDLIELIHETFQATELTAKEKGISLYIRSDMPNPYFVNADRDKIKQVFINLLINSVKYGNKNGNTVVSFYNVDNKSCLIEVTDNGLGIAEQHLSRLFERFYRVDTSRSRDEGGTGLGLAIVKHIIEAHSQTINVRSTIDVGSTFAFTLERA